MAHAGVRTATGLLVLMLVWIVVYWMWQPGTLRPDAKITFAESRLPIVGPRPEEHTAFETEGPDDVQEQVAPARSAPVVELQTVIPPRFREYTVRDGDTFEVIASRELGSRALWMQVARANPLRDPRRLRPGDVIRLPIDPDNVQGRSETGGAEPEPLNDLDDTPIVYLVKSGDSLSSIAEAYYGSQGFAEFIFRRNRDVLRSMDDLSIGMQLRLPPVPGG